jgi:hypothetical protein
MDEPKLLWKRKKKKRELGILNSRHAIRHLNKWKHIYMKLFPGSFFEKKKTQKYLRKKNVYYTTWIGI